MEVGWDGRGGGGKNTSQVMVISGGTPVYLALCSKLKYIRTVWVRADSFLGLGKQDGVLKEEHSPSVFTLLHYSELSLPQECPMA